MPTVLKMMTLAILPGAKAHLARPAASASFRDMAGQAGSASAKQVWAASVSIQLLSMLEAFLAMPLWMVAGKPHPTGPFHWKCSTSALRVLCRRPGVAGLRCGDAVAFANQLPSFGVDQAALIPDPNIYPSICIQNLPFIVPVFQWSAGMKMAAIRQGRIAMRDPADLFSMQRTIASFILFLLTPGQGRQRPLDMLGHHGRRFQAAPVAERSGPRCWLVRCKATARLRRQR